MGSYQILLGPILNGADLYEEGGTISLAEAEAAPLVELGIIEQLPAKTAKPRKPAD